MSRKYNKKNMTFMEAISELQKGAIIGRMDKMNRNITLNTISVSQSEFWPDDTDEIILKEQNLIMGLYDGVYESDVFLGHVFLLFDDIIATDWYSRKKEEN